MGQCYARDFAIDNEDVVGGGGGDGDHDHDHRQFPSETSPAKGPLAARCSTGNPRPGHYPRSNPSGPLDTAKTHSPSRSTPWRFFSRPFPPPSPAKHIKAALARRQGSRARSDHATDCAGSSGLAPEEKPPLDKNFGFGTNFAAKYGLEKEIGRGHFGHTCSARVTKGDYKGQLVAVKIISKDKMTTAIAIKDVRREVMILKALSHHENMVKLYDACEDSLNVYIVMELCEGGELLDRILWRGGRYAEEDAKVIIVQILNVIAFFHLQGVVHRDLKPENFLFTATDEKAPMKIIDFGLSDFVKPDERLNDIVGSAYYVAPEVLHRSYGVEADIWSIGVISYILLCGSRPFWARTESGIFHSVLRDDPNLNESPWPFISPEAKDFVRRLLNKDYRKRMTAVQALTHPWLLDRSRQVPLDILIYKLVKSYIRVTPFKQAALKALSKALTETELIYIRSQFVLLEPNDDDHVSFENFRTALRRNATDAMKESKVFDFLNALEPLLKRTMDFEDFCAATISPYQLEALENWGEISSAAFEYFEEEGNRAISVGELATEMNLTSVAHNMIRGWIRPTDGKLSFYGYTKFLHGVTIRNSSARQHR